MSTFGHSMMGRSKVRHRGVSRLRAIARGASALAILAGTAVTIGTTATVALTPGTAVADPTWTAGTLPITGLSPPVASDGGIDAKSVACASSTSCVAVGEYVYGTSSSTELGFIETGALVGGTWQWKAITAPEAGLSPPFFTGYGQDPDGFSILGAVSCGTATSCVAVGDYSYGTNSIDTGEDGLIETGTNSGGTWTWKASSVPLGSLRPAIYTYDGMNLGGAGLSGVSCSVSSCTAIGSYGYETSGVNAILPEPLIWTNAAGGWKQESLSTSALSPVPGPDNGLLALSSVSCPSTTSCVASGHYSDASNADIGFVAQGNPLNANWTATNDTAASPGAPSNFSATAISCPSTTSCVIAGHTDADQSLVESGSLVKGNWSWKLIAVPSTIYLYGTPVSCPTIAFCITVGGVSADQFVTAVPTEGEWKWTAANAPTSGLNPSINASYPAPVLTDVACKSTTCMGVGAYDPQGESSDTNGLFEAAQISAGPSEGIVVNTTSDEKIDEKALSPDSGSPFCAIDANADDRQCSLRAAIQLVNKLGGDQTITFDIPGTGVPTISPSSSLPAITASATIDATTQAGGWVELSGAKEGGGDGLSLESANTTVRGLVVNGFSAGAGIKIAKGSGDNIVGDRIGTNASGMTAVPNKYGVYVDAPGATIGGTMGTSATGCTGDCDLLSGNSESQITGEGSNSGIPFGELKVQGDWIGPNASGDAALSGPDSDGVRLTASDDNAIPASDAVLVGGDTSRPGLAPGNVIVSDGGTAMYVSGLGTGGGVAGTITGNLIGLNPSGQAALGRGFDGIFASGHFMIGGTDRGAGNVVSGFKRDGIVAANSEIIGDLIGTNIDGTTAIGNLVGVYEEKFDTMDDDVVSGNSTGVTGEAYVTLGYGNIIGLNRAGTAAVPNGVGVNSGLILAGIPKATFDGAACPTSPCDVVSGNKNAGIESDSAEFVDVQGTYIGTDLTGNVAVPNGTGILLSDVDRPPGATWSDALKDAVLEAVGAKTELELERSVSFHEPPTLQLGGSSSVAQTGKCSSSCDIVAGNTGDGVFLQSYQGLNEVANRHSYVEGSLIGIGADGTPLPNGGPGILITGVPTTLLMDIGGSAEAANVLTGSTSPAISVTRRTGQIKTAPVRMIGNSFHMVGSAAPIYRPKNPAPPSLSDILQVGSDVEVKGKVSAREFFGHDQTLELYATTSCSGTLHPVGQFTITNLSGDFDVKVARADLGTSKFISALVTDGDGNTSKFPTLDGLPWTSAAGC